MVVVLATAFAGGLAWSGLQETSELVRDREVRPVAESGAVIECFKERIADAVPAGARIALVDTDDLLGQVVLERLTPRYRIVARPRDAEYLVTVVRNDWFECEPSEVTVRERVP